MRFESLLFAVTAAVQIILQQITIMDKSLDSWIHNFTINDIIKHKKGFTLYKITSIVFPRYIPEALSSVTVWKRFSDIKKLHKDIHKKHRDLHISGTVPQAPAETNYFKRFDIDVIEERKRFILELLNFISEHCSLYKSQVFIEFFNASHSLSPNESPKHNKTDNNSINIPKGNITSICSELNIPDESGIDLIDPSRDHVIGSMMKLEVEAGSSTTLKPKVTEELYELGSNDITVDYLYEAAYEFSQAVQNEVNCNYFKAFEFYKSGIDKLLNGAKNDQNEERQGIAKVKVCQYLTRAESIYEKYILNHMDDTQYPILDDNKNVKDLEKPLELLSRYKVLKIIHNVMQVQDITDKKCYIMKAIEKPASTQIVLSPNTSHMASLIAYFQTDYNIYLLLKHESGGRLWDYILSYDTYPTDTKHIMESLDNIFISIDQPLSDDEESESTVIESVEGIKEIIENQDDSDDIATQTTEDTPFFDELSMDMNIKDLVSCGQRLIQSVSETLENVQTSEKKVNCNKKVDFIMNLSTVKDICIEISNTTENLDKMPTGVPKAESHNKSINDNILLPEGIVRQWSAELIIAIRNLHSNGIICGDLNIRNLLLGCRGQLLITYFYKKNYNSLNALSNYAVNNLYVAPERPLNYTSDWWSVGVIIYELLTKKSFLSCHPSGILSYYQIQYPANVNLSVEAIDFLEKLLAVDPDLRLGKDIKEIEKHAFFNTIDWESVRSSGIYDLNYSS